jgi:hypothetical protein
MARTLAFVVLLLALSSSCTPHDDAEDGISALMDQTVAALANKDAAALALLLDNGYEDDAKRNKKDIEALAAHAFARGPVLLRMRDPEVITDVETATIVVSLLAGNAGATSKSPADLTPANAVPLRLFVNLRRDGNRVSRVFRASRWKIIAVNGLPP